ncbi:MAG: T9SS type A sorting domain-containing protein [Bacteroidetes bacterium]|nr:T9SS type A sorting domain-containing protein [Bacteroidota bacterium]
MRKTLLLIVLLLGGNMAIQAQVTNGLVAKYSFNGGNADDEVGSNHGTVTGATLTTDRFGNADMAYSFDGIDDHIDLTDGAEFQMGTGDFSISLWVNYTVAQQGVIFSKRDGATSNYSQYNISVIANPQFGGISKNVWTFERCSASDDRSALVGDISGSWKHVVFVHGYMDSTIIYVDGQYVAHDMGWFGGQFNVAGRPLVLGYHSENMANFFNGQLDDMRVYNRKLGESEVITLYNELNPALAIDPQANPAQAITVFPNPTNSMLQIAVAQPTTITVVDVLGKHHSTIAIETEKTLDVSEFESGIYFLRDLNTGKAIKFIKE